jgi:hypothetical protein
MAANGVKQSNGTVPVLNGHTSYAVKHNLADHFIGGNRLENAVAGPVKDFVQSHDGHTVITNVSYSPITQRMADSGDLAEMTRGVEEAMIE